MLFIPNFRLRTQLIKIWKIRCVHSKYDPHFFPLFYIFIMFAKFLPKCNQNFVLKAKLSQQSSIFLNFFFNIRMTDKMMALPAHMMSFQKVHKTFLAWNHILWSFFTGCRNFWSFICLFFNI